MQPIRLKIGNTAASITLYTDCCHFLSCYVKSIGQPAWISFPVWCSLSVFLLPVISARYVVVSIHSDQILHAIWKQASRSFLSSRWAQDSVSVCGLSRFPICKPPALPRFTLTVQLWLDISVSHFLQMLHVSVFLSPVLCSAQFKRLKTDMEQLSSVGLSMYSCWEKRGIVMQD